MLRPLFFIGLAGVVLAALPPSALCAQPAAPQNDQPLQIQADSGIEWQQDAHLYIARGNAVAIRGPGELHADTLIAHYREVKAHGAPGNTGGNTGGNMLGNTGGNMLGNTGGNTEIYRVEAEGHVLLKRGEKNVVGDRADYDVDRAIAVMTGRNLKLTTPTDTVTARDSLEWYDQKQIAVARGDAVAIRNGRTIKADVLTAYTVKTAPAPGKPAPAHGKPPVTPAAAHRPAPLADTESSKISRVDAQGHVVVSNGLDVGRGDFGVYNADTGIATLIGNVVIERGKDVIRGQRGVMDLNKNISRMLPGGAPGIAHQRVQGLFVREDRAARPGQPVAKPPAAKTPLANPGGERSR